MIHSAFILGLVGSLHCLGMCGPISLLVPANPRRYLLSRAIYNSGRITTYVLLGLFIGVLGQQTGFYLSQKYLFIALGVLILTFTLLPIKFKSKIDQSYFITRFTASLRRGISQLSSKGGKSKQFLFGILNGLLPCGMVYAALSGAFVLGSLKEGALYMLFFGIGTLPVMMSFGFIGKWIPSGLKSQKVFIYAYLILGVFFIYKGMHLPTMHGEMTLCKAP
ncbi:sulfite exporter TauE/SafE family protein [Leadbetterella byssophila]|uniref:sulfite exporter TauE/SafE family protein n=1 Tax=Leadbetterella byssophila TaxID=316068 RepID=UPI0039A3DFF6